MKFPTKEEFAEALNDAIQKSPARDLGTSSHTEGNKVVIRFDDKKNKNVSFEYVIEVTKRAVVR